MAKTKSSTDGTISVLAIEDVHVNEDNYRDVTRAGVDTLARSIEAGGQLDEIEVWADGGIYRVIDGNHRLAAMVKLGMTHIAAKIVDDPTDETAVVHSVGRNLHIPTTPLEDSRGAQLMFRTGIKPVAVAAHLGIKDTDLVERVKRGYDLVADDTRAEEMTLDWLAAVAEVAEDADAVRKLYDAKPGTWERTFEEIMRTRRQEASLAEAKAIIEEAGCEFIQQTRLDKHHYLSAGTTPPALAKYATVYVDQWSCIARITWYDDAATATESPAEAAEREEADKRRADIAEARTRRLAFVAAYLDTYPATHETALLKFAEGRWLDEDDGVYAGLGMIAEELGTARGFVANVYAALICSADDEVEEVADGIAWLRYLDALVAVGYELSEVESVLADTLRESVEKAEAEREFAEQPDTVAELEAQQAEGGGEE